MSRQDYLAFFNCIGHLDKSSNGNFGANQGPGHPMLIPVRSPSHRAEQLTKSSKPSLGKVNPNLLVLLASALSWAEETFRLEAVLFKELRVDDFSQFLFPLQSFAKNTTDGSSGEEVWPDWAKVNLLGRFSKFWATFSNIGQVFCQIWGTFGGFLKPSFTLGRLFLNEELGSSIFSPSESGHTEATMVSFFITEMGMTKFVITFQLAWFLRKYAKVVVNQLYISCRVSCFSGDSTTACTISKEAKQVSRNQPQLE